MNTDRVISEKSSGGLVLIFYFINLMNCLRPGDKVLVGSYTGQFRKEFVMFYIWFTDLLGLTDEVDDINIYTVKFWKELQRKNKLLGFSFYWDLEDTIQSN